MMILTASNEVAGCDYDFIVILVTHTNGYKIMLGLDLQKFPKR